MTELKCPWGLIQVSPQGGQLSGQAPIGAYLWEDASSTKARPILELIQKLAKIMSDNL